MEFHCFWRIFGYYFTNLDWYWAVLTREEREADERTDSIYVRWAARIDVTSPGSPQAGTHVNRSEGETDPAQTPMRNKMIGDTFNGLEGQREIRVKGLLVKIDGSIARGVRHQLTCKKFCEHGKVSVSRWRRRREKTAGRNVLSGDREEKILILLHCSCIIFNQLIYLPLDDDWPIEI